MPINTILTASAALENANLAALGITHAFDEPPETLKGSRLPVSVRFSEGAPMLHGSRLLGRYNLYNWKLEVHWPRGVLQSAVEQCFPTVRAYQDLYTANLSISGTCDVNLFRDPSMEGPVYLRYGPDDVDTIGFIFYFVAKEILDDITVEL